MRWSAIDYYRKYSIEALVCLRLLFEQESHNVTNFKLITDQVRNDLGEFELTLHNFELQMEQRALRYSAL